MIVSYEWKITHNRSASNSEHPCISTPVLEYMHVTYKYKVGGVVTRHAADTATQTNTSSPTIHHILLLFLLLLTCEVRAGRHM
jgi:hypothetical protein